VQLDICLEIEKTGSLPPCIGVRPAHEAVPDQSDAQSLRHAK